MNSFYHPREHEREANTHFAPHDGSHHADGHEGRDGHEAQGDVAGGAGHVVPAWYAGNQPDDASQGSGVEPATQSPEHSDREQDLYQVLLAVERGELSPEDAARKLEEMEASGQQEGGAGPN